ncbi:MAG: alpha/beta hydrolase, partial [Asticcacaulis sp.]
MNRRDILAGASLLMGLAGSAAAQTAAPDVAPDKRRAIAGWPEPAGTIDLWPAGEPGRRNSGLTEVVTDDAPDPSVHFRWLSGVTRPRMAVFPAARPNGAAMLVIPGGGYARNYFDHEGYQLAKVLDDHGISAFVLFYRLPAEGWDNAPDVPVADAQRAMRLIRAHAQRFGIDVARVGAIGFSAGGHLCASLGTRHDAKVYTPADPADGLSARPFLIAPIYPVISMDMSVTHTGSRDSLLGHNPTAEQLRVYSPDRMVTRATPPAFLVQAEDDTTVPVANSLLFRAACRAAGVTVETHLFAEGGHGFGMKPDAG